MRFLVPALFLTSITALAQGIPQYEAFVGGNYARVHSSGAEAGELFNITDSSFTPHNLNYNMYGFEASFTENANSWFGMEADANWFFANPKSTLLSSATTGNSPVPVHEQFQTYMFGPRFTTSHNGRLTFFVHVPVGAAIVRSRIDEQVNVGGGLNAFPAGPLTTSAGYALSPGAGIEIHWNSHLTLRAVQADYLMTHAFGHRQDNFQVGAGLCFTFGER